jgi:hypothetical protein
VEAASCSWFVQILLNYFCSNNVIPPILFAAIAGMKSKRPTALNELDVSVRMSLSFSVWIMKCERVQLFYCVLIRTSVDAAWPRCFWNNERASTASVAALHCRV